MMEALACHPLGRYLSKLCRTGTDTSADTIKVRMQLSRRARAPGVCAPLPWNLDRPANLHLGD